MASPRVLVAGSGVIGMHENYVSFDDLAHVFGLLLLILIQVIHYEIMKLKLI